ncbi:MAG TPA: efflux RND transporter periplasmic adaptor subunit [Methylovirgula sp.]|nr:efflux RND transporter periplasmic adaptor subunit [Methylovirgula sp.]
MENAANLSPKEAKRLGRKVKSRLLLAALVAMGVAFFGVTTREKNENALTQWTQAQAVPTVDIVQPERGVGSQDLTLPGNVEAWYQAPLYARVNGYVKMWYKDIGAKVKAGDLLADIDTPDLDQQYEQAKGELAKAQADETLAELTAKRWQAMRNTAAVSQQDADVKAGEYEASKAAVVAAKANVAKLAALESYKKIIAPFGGVVTARNVDVGALVNSTPTNSRLGEFASSGTPSPLFEIADLDELRIYVSVPQSFSAQISVGMNAELKLPQYPDRSFEAAVATTSNAISSRGRALLVELHRDNKDGVLQPGSFAEVHFKLPANQEVLRIPASALMFRRDRPEVATIGSDDKVVLKPIQVGRDLGTEVEVLSGLTTNDRVIRSPWDSISEGDKVHVAGGEPAPELSAR